MKIKNIIEQTGAAGAGGGTTSAASFSNPTSPTSGAFVRPRALRLKRLFPKLVEALRSKRAKK
jgi:hypothetical protein